MLSKKIRLKTCIAVLVLSLLVSLSERGGAERHPGINKWEKTLLQAKQHLVDGSYSRALKMSKRVADEMIDHLGTGPAAEYSLAVTLVIRSLAEAGLQNEDESLWYWHVAVGLYPDMAEANLSRYGEPGRFLGANLPSADSQEGVRDGGDIPPSRASRVPLLETGEGVAGNDSPKVITKPKVIRKPRIEWPAGALILKISGKLTVEVIIDEEGVPHSPKVLRALPAPSLTFVALEAIKDWEYEPARIDGKPVAVNYALTVTYALRK